MGRWFTIDLLAEKHFNYTPYAYVHNSPINLIDPNGMDTLNFNESGKYIETIPADGDHVGSVAGKDGYNFKFADERWTKEFTTDEFPTSIEMGGDGGKYNSVYLAPKKIIDKTLEASGVKDFWKKHLL